MQQEVIIKKAFAEAREAIKYKRPVTRKRIEDIKESIELEQTNDFEVLKEMLKELWWNLYTTYYADKEKPVN